MEELIKNIKNSVFFINLESRLKNKDLLLTGLEGSQKNFVMSALAKEDSPPILIVTSDTASAESVYHDLQVFLGKERVYILPSYQVLYLSGVLGQSREIVEIRLNAIKATQKKGTIIIAPLPALLTRMISVDLWKKNMLTLELGQELSLDKLSESLLGMGYERIAQVEEKGQFSVRGGLVDLYDPTWKLPLRIEFFGDEIDSLRFFDPTGQRSVGKTKKISISPAREIILSNQTLAEGKENLHKELAKIIGQHDNQGNQLAKQEIATKINTLTERIDSEQQFAGLEQYFTSFYGQGNHFLDYLPKDSLLLLDEPLRIEEVEGKIREELNEMQASFISEGVILPSQTENYWSFSQMIEKRKQNCLIFSLFARKTPYVTPQTVESISARALTIYHGHWELLKEELETWEKENYDIYFITRGPEREKNIKEFIESHQIRMTSKIRFIASEGSPSNGFLLTEHKLVVLTEQEILPRKRRKTISSGKKEGIKLADYKELRVSDYIVHEQHGIGQYKGIRTLEINGAMKDYLFIEYAGTDKLFVPTEQIDLIKKYVGSEGKAPKLYSLGGQEWSRVKNRVKASVEEMAKELLELYAEREAGKGYAFSADQAWQSDFDDQFPYKETEDQQRAILALREDMEKEKPMDRLICGDVGYGKTEVALRGIFKAAVEGKQAAFLVPTTILAQQHYRNFSERFEKFPIEVGVLSRFQSTSQQKEVLKGLKNGSLDVVIGTHRLLSKDIVFKDLGLLVVDEEQRFGVRHKERLKMFKKNVDVLTLTATPIPRTLQMSLVKVRDLSVIETPPENRYPVQTYVLEHNDYLVKEAVMREIQRGGQAYYVFNRVKGIKEQAAKLQKLLPRVRIGVAHGQMSETRLEKVMYDFLNNEYDLLLSTTIVEAGLDIPNVNTMIIHDADKLGLAQLYQLRGRVGRSNRVAYCYLTYKKDKVLSQIAEKRLQAIKEFTELGSGFKIALRDLEIRGAGNMLGPEQHGFMDAIGFDLYYQLLENAIKELKGEPVKERDPQEDEIRVNVGVSAYIPHDYMEDESQKITLYQRIATAENEKELLDLKKEVRDRFGSTPKSLKNLFAVSSIKLLARDLKVKELDREKDEVFFTVPKDLRLDSDGLYALIRQSREYVRVMALKGYKFKIKVSSMAEEEIITYLNHLLIKIKDLAVN